MPPVDDEVEREIRDLINDRDRKDRWAKQVEMVLLSQMVEMEKTRRAIVKMLDDCSREVTELMQWNKDTMATQLAELRRLAGIGGPLPAAMRTDAHTKRDADGR